MSKRTTKHFNNLKVIFFSTVLMAFAAVFVGAVFAGFNKTQADTNTAVVSSWWPASGVSLSGTQPFKGALSNWNVSKYDMYWSVDGGAETLMPSNFNGIPHKESHVNLDNWNWSATGVYSVTYIAKSNNGSEINRTSFNVTVTHPVSSIVPAGAPSAPASTTTVPATTTLSSSAVTPISASPSVQSGLKFYVNPSSPARTQADAWRASRPADAAQIDKIANNSAAKWFGDWNTAIQDDVNTYVSSAAGSGAIPVLVAYNVPQRDCGSYSAGGANGGDAYLAWVTGFAHGIGVRSAWVILEPDATAGMSCLSATDQATRLSLLSQAVSILKANPNTRVYLDAGNPHWISAATMAGRLASANLAAADGFSLNVSNFFTNSENIAFGQDLSNRTNGKHFVIDTSRNGLGATADNQWCNPAGRALGSRPTSSTGSALVDAFLWIKGPGESDGACNGAPAAGVWMPDYALGLASRAAY